jgi:membrane protease YdiL (CAAX protease family)
MIMSSSDPTGEPGNPPEPDGEALVWGVCEGDTPGPAKAAKAARPWGPWATLAWTFLAIAVLIVFQGLVFAIFAAVKLASNPHADLMALTTDGNVFAVASLATTPPVVGLVVLLIYARRYPIGSYLACTWPTARVASLAIAGQLLVLVASDLTTYSLGRPISPPIMVELYRSASLPLFLLALLVAAPVGEEILFRGFLFKGITESRLGPIAAIVISSITWALLHIQYDWYGIVTVMAMGLYLGWARSWSGSVPLTIALHFLANLVATAEIVVQELGLV